MLVPRKNHRENGGMLGMVPQESALYTPYIT